VTIRRPELPIAAALGLLLLVVAGRYGYHRDELYFLEAGYHLAWGYPDQPPLVPAIARLASEIAPDSLVVLRIPSLLIAMAVVVLAGVMARRLRAGTGGQALAAASTALCGFVLGMGHLLSTATLDLLGWTLLTYLFLRLLQGDDHRLWLVAGLVAGLTMQANVLVAFLLAGFAIAVLIVGPRRLLASPWLWIGAGIAALFAVPYLLWQADHSWPQLDIASNISSGGSGSSASRPAFLPLLVLQAGPWLLPVWLFGLVRLWRDVALRCLAATFGVLIVVFLIAGGKPYYLAGLFPLLFAAGAQPLLDWVHRRWIIPALLILSTPAILFALPVLPVRDANPVVNINYDIGETVGWPQHVQTIADAYHRLPPGTAILAGNYGEAGAIDRYGPDLGLPRAYSGHNGFAYWGRPPDSTPVLALGIDRSVLNDACARLDRVGQLGLPYGIDNDEDGTPLWYCVPRTTWDELWPKFVILG
jgi:4-amino-4-deoxy-L-arabinose transferase-like glycosyltransferase